MISWSKKKNIWSKLIKTTVHVPHMYVIWCVDSVVVFGMVVFFDLQCLGTLGLAYEASSTPPVFIDRAFLIANYSTLPR